MDLGTQLPIDATENAPLHITASFAGYRANWTVPEAKLKPGVYAQPMTAPRLAPADPAAVNKSEVTDRDLVDLAARAAAAKALPAVTLHYRIEAAAAR